VRAEAGLEHHRCHDNEQQQLKPSQQLVADAQRERHHCHTAQQPLQSTNKPRCVSSIHMICGHPPYSTVIANKVATVLGDKKIQSFEIFLLMHFVDKNLIVHEMHQ